MKQFKNYIEHIESKRRKLEEETSKMLGEKDENIFFKKHITPALNRIAKENSTFKYEYANYNETANTVSNEYKLTVEETDYHESSYHLTVKIDGDARYNGVQILLKNEGSGNEIEALKDHNEIDENSFEEILTDLLIRLYEIES